MAIKPPVLITGCARSGTSMTAAMVHLSGGFGGNIFPDKSNGRAHHENLEIRDRIVKPFLLSKNFDPKGQSPLPSSEYLTSLDERDGVLWREKILKAMTSQGLGSEMDWYYKGAKMCLFWPLWYYAFPGAKWIVVRRKREDIVSSCCRTGFMNAFRDDEEKWGKWVDVHLSRFEEMKESGVRIREVWPEKWVLGDLSEIRETIEWLGLEWKEEETRALVKPSLWKRGEYVRKS